MKHLFLVHSHITYLVALQAVRVQELQPESCVFLLDRGYTPESISFQSVVFPYQSYPKDSFELTPFFWKNRKKIQDLDQWIMATTSGERFQWYVPQSGMNFFYLITNHSACEGFWFLEEGTAAYRDRHSLNHIKPSSKPKELLYWLNFGGRSPYQKFFFDTSHHKYRGCFGISNEAFKGFENKIVVPNPFAALSAPADVKCVLVLESLVAYQMLREETYLRVLVKVLDHAHASGISVVHYKAPTLRNDFEDLQGRMLGLLQCESSSKSIQLIELSPSFPLESLCASQLPIRFYLLTSSVGIYASMFGKEVVSHLPMVLTLEPAFAERLKGVPMEMWKDFVFLDEGNNPAELGLEKCV